SMSEQDKVKGYMQQLDDWIDANVISPLYVAYCESGTDRAKEQAEEAVHKAIREKALESYHNGKRSPSRNTGGRWGTIGAKYAKPTTQGFRKAAASSADCCWY